MQPIQACVIILNPALVITEPAQLAATVGKTDVSCFGANNGIITIINPAGGYGTYQYTINGGTTWSAIGNFTSLAPGTYDVRIRDAAYITCELVLNGALVITQPAVLAAASWQYKCYMFWGADGTITITNPPEVTVPMNTLSMAEEHGRHQEALQDLVRAHIMYRSGMQHILVV